MSGKLTCSPSSDKTVFGLFANEELKELLQEARNQVEFWLLGDQEAKVKAFALSKKLEEKFGYFLTGGAETATGFLESIEQITCIELHNHEIPKRPAPDGEIWVVE